MKTKIEFVVLNEEQAKKVTEYLNGVKTNYDFCATWEHYKLVDHYVYNVIVSTDADITPINMFGIIVSLFACELF